MDITELILHQHHEQRRAFALLGEVPRDDAVTLGAIWSRLAVALEVHAEAEEKFLYPRLLKVGVGGGDADSAEEETEDAIGDHNEIRDAISETNRHQPGSDAWWKGALEANVANSDHMAEEERQVLPDFRLNADLQTRHDLAVEFIRYESLNYQGIEATNDDPDRYIEQHS